MRGRGEAWGAVSFVNAVEAGIGCAAAIRLPVVAEFELLGSSDAATSLDPGASDRTPLVRHALSEAMESVGVAPGAAFRFSLRSAIPAGRGLKSSSAVPVAIRRAVGAAARAPVSAEEAARFAVRIGRDVGLSATGAFDDACAASEGGIFLTDNRTDVILRRWDPPNEWRVVIGIPPDPHPPAAELRERFQGLPGDPRAPAMFARQAQFLAAMEANTERVEGAMGYHYRELRSRLRSVGALGVGVSGFGPSLAAVVGPRGVEEVRTEMSQIGETLVLPFVHWGPTAGETAPR